MGSGASTSSKQIPKKRRRLSSWSILATCVLTTGLAAAQSEKAASPGVNTASSVTASRPATAASAASSATVKASPTKLKPKLATPDAKVDDVKSVEAKAADPKSSETKPAGAKGGEPKAVTTKGDTKKKEAAAAKAAAEPTKAAAEVSTEADAGAAGDTTSDSTSDATDTQEAVVEAPVGPLVVPPPPVTVSPTPSTAASAPPPAAPPPPSLGVTYLNRSVFLVATDGSKQSKERAKHLSEALKVAIEKDEKAMSDSPNVELLMQGTDHVELRVRGYVVGVLTDKDAVAARQPDLQSYAKALDDGLELFIADQRRKVALQGVAMRVAIAMVVSIIGLFCLRLAQSLFARADEYIDEHSGAIRPFRILGVPVIGVEGLNAIITAIVAIGRIATLIGVAVVTAAIALAQFDLTRPWIAVATKWSTARFLSGFEELVLILPRLLLAAALLLVGSAAVRVARVLFDDTTTTATPWGTMSRRRARVLRILVPVGVFVLVVPLAVAAVFGRFHTPIELVIIALVLGASLGLAPLVAAGGMGLAATWHGALLNGDYISIGNMRGRVVRVNPFWVELEDENGARRDVPLLALVNQPVTHHMEPAPQRILVKIKRPIDIPAALESVQKLVKEICGKRNVECIGFDSDHAHFVIEVWTEPQQTADLVRRLSDPQIEHPVLELTRLQYPDMVRGPAGTHS